MLSCVCFTSYHCLVGVYQDNVYSLNMTSMRGRYKIVVDPSPTHIVKDVKLLMKVHTLLCLRWNNSEWETEGCTVS